MTPCRAPATYDHGVDLISHPFRLATEGRVATVLDGSEQAQVEAIAVLALTRRGERRLVPDFGIADPAFGRLSVAELNTALLVFGPPGLSVDSLVATPTSEAATRVVLTYSEQP